MSVFSSFGQQQQQQQQKPATSLFGAPPQSTNAFSVFGQPQQNQQQQQQQQQPQQPQQQQQQPSLFGGQAQSAGTNLFGVPTGATNASQPTTNLFGSSTTQQQPQQQQQQHSTGLFGQPATTGLFGSSATSSQPQQQQTSLFGFGNIQQPTQNPFGGFGASTTTLQQNQPTTSLFGQPMQSQQPQQLTALNTPQFTRTTKFNDLPEDVRKKFEQIDAHIQGRVQISTDLKQHKLGDEPQKGAEQIRSVHKDLVNSINKLRTDVSAMRELRARMDQAVQDTIAATRIIDAFKSGQSGQSGQSQQSVWLKNYAGFPLEFFTRVTEQLRERLQWFSNTLEQIERKLASEANHVSITPQSITSTLQAQHASFVALANKTAALDGELQKLKNTYRTLWRARTGSARDPFNELDRRGLEGGEFGLEGLSVA